MIEAKEGSSALKDVDVNFLRGMDADEVIAILRILEPSVAEIIDYSKNQIPMSGAVDPADEYLWTRGQIRAISQAFGAYAEEVRTAQLMAETVAEMEAGSFDEKAAENLLNMPSRYVKALLALTEATHDQITALMRCVPDFPGKDRTSVLDLPTQVGKHNLRISSLLKTLGGYAMAN